VYKGPVGNAPELSEEDFLMAAMGRSQTPPEKKEKKVRLSGIKYLKRLKELEQEGVEFPPNHFELKNYLIYRNNLRDFLEVNADPNNIEWDESNQSFRLEYKYDIFHGDNGGYGEMKLVYYIEPGDDIKEKVQEIIENRKKLIKGNFTIKG